MEPSRALALALALVSPAAAQTAAAPELTGTGTPALSSARAVAAADAAARPLFFVREKEGRHLLTIYSGQLDKPFLFSATISRGLGEKGVYSGAPLEHFLFTFRRVGNQIQFVRLNTDFRAAPGSPEAAGVKVAYPDVPLAAVAIATENAATGSMTFPAEGLFLDDLTDVKAMVASAYKTEPAAMQYIKTMTRLEHMAAFHPNVEIEVSFLFKPPTAIDSGTQSDGRFLPVAVRYSLSVLGADGFDERPLDPRVGAFPTSITDYSDPALKDKAVPIRRLAEHWRLEKVDPGAAISDVKKPIVWWIDETTPKEYREAIRAGILAWNEAFEASGLSHVMVVKEVDKDMSPAERANFNPADASYNMVRWMLGPDAGFAFGPSRADPRTGEIYSATVMLGYQMSRPWDTSTKLAVASARRVEDFGPDPDVMAALQSQGLSPEEKDKVVQQYLTWAVMHEIGHTLGLTHNFEGSRLLGLDEMGKDGLLSSTVMDYLPTNIPAPGKPKVYSQTKAGPWDKFVLEYLYKPMSADPVQKAQALRQIARRADSDPALAYGPDSDLKGINPDIQRFDFSREPVRYADQMIDRAEKLWGRAANGFVPEVTPPPFTALTLGVDTYDHAVESVLPLIGGVRSDRRPADEGGPRLSPVPAAEQSSALNFLSRRVFAADSFAVPPALVLNAAPDPLEDSSGHGLPDVTAAALSLQRQALDHLYDPAVLQRLAVDEQTEPATAFKTSALFETVRRSIWSETQPRSAWTPFGAKKRVDISPLRRRLQRAHLDALVKVVRSAASPADAAALARADLAAIARDAGRAEARAVDPTVKAHLAEIVRLAGRDSGGADLDVAGD